MNRNIYQFGIALASGTVFGLGLSLSGMLNPVRVQGFLDVLGAWDPSLAFVLGGAVVVAFIGLQVMKRMRLGDRRPLSGPGGCIPLGWHPPDSPIRPRHAGRHDLVR